MNGFIRFISIISQCESGNVQQHMKNTSSK